MSNNLSEKQGFINLVIEFLSFPTFIAQSNELVIDKTSTELHKNNNDRNK